MAQVAYSTPACREAAYRDAEAVSAADPHVAWLAYGEAPSAAAPYPSAMRRARRRARLTALACLAATAAAGWAVLAHPRGPDPVREEPNPGPVVVAADTAPAPGAKPVPVPSIAWMLDPTPALGAGAATIGRAPPPPAFRVAAAPAEPSPAVRDVARTLAQIAPDRVAPDEAPPDKAAPEPVRIAAADPAPAALTPRALVPLPVARPPELRQPEQRQPPAARVAARTLPRTRDVFRAAMAEEPSFFEKLFGTGAAAPREAPRQALAYASPDGLPQEAPRARISPSPDMTPSAGVAVYDISARTVTLPSGEVLEAHSGLGEAMDDPRYVHLRMRGSTPPGTYDLTERERLFHGVRAIRLNPVGGSGAIHGRDGLLAHTYMLRQPGASNGCVSFRNYDRFLQAFLRGEIRRLVVVAGGRGDLFGRRIGLADRPGDRG